MKQGAAECSVVDDIPIKSQVASRASRTLLVLSVSQQVANEESDVDGWEVEKDKT